MPTALPALEELLNDRPDVLEARVIDYGADGPLIALVRPDGYASGPELRDACAARLDIRAADRLTLILTQRSPADEELGDPGKLLAAATYSYPYERASTDTERRLVRLWNEVLERERTGVLDDFLDIGGDSVRAVRIITRMQLEFGVRIDIVDFFDSASIRDLAVLVDAA